MRKQPDNLNWDTVQETPDWSCQCHEQQRKADQHDY